MDWSASRRIDLHSGDRRLACGDVIQLFIDRTERPATPSSVFVRLAGHSPPPSLFDRASPAECSDKISTRLGLFAADRAVQTPATRRLVRPLFDFARPAFFRSPILAGTHSYFVHVCSNAPSRRSPFAFRPRSLSLANLRHPPPPPECSECAVVIARRSSTHGAAFVGRPLAHYANAPITNRSQRVMSTDEVENGILNGLADRRRVCKYCDKVCSSSSALLYHTRLHTGERPYVCKHCNKGFIQKVHLQRHVENNHETKDAPSSSDFSSRNGAPTMVRAPAIGNRLEAVATQLKLSRAEPSKCSHCDERFMGRIALLEHVYERHQEASGDGAEGDLRVESDGNEDAQIERPDTASDAAQTGSRAETIQCQQCDLICFGQVAYLEHVFEAHQALPDNPQEIPVETAEQDDVKSAVSRTKESGGGNGNTWCHICLKHLSSPTALVVHMRAHSGDRPFTCPHESCGKTFMHQNSMKIHMMSHSGHRPHACKVCGKAFTTTRTLKIHSMIHTGERPYGCKFCGRRFIQQIHLLRHIKSHIRKGSTQSTPETDANSHSSSSQTRLNNSTPSTGHQRKQQRPSLSSARIGKTHIDGRCASRPTGVVADNMDMDDDDDDGNNSDFSPADEQSGTFADSSTGNNDHGSPSNNANDAPSNNCLNCQLFNGELSLLKAEVSQLKQFLGAKLTLMETKLLGMQRCLNLSSH
uniref:C2H2-type domain-containing protein n=1 Tax=Plectus sambesii TaxID=2011161 RepID=A0A914WGI9_9BILA